MVSSQPRVGGAAMLLVAVALTASIGYFYANRALQQAEVSSQLAMEALNSIYQQLSPGTIGHTTIGHTSTDMGEDDPDVAYVAVERAQPSVSPETAKVLESLLVFYDRLAQQVDEQSQVAFEAGVALRRMGDIRQRLGQYDQAEQAYEQALAKLRLLESTADLTPVIALESARATTELGNLKVARFEHDEARQAFEESLAILGRVGPDRLTPDHQFKLARTHYQLARSGRFGMRGGIGHSRRTGHPSGYRRRDAERDGNRRVPPVRPDGATRPEDADRPKGADAVRPEVSPGPHPPGDRRRERKGDGHLRALPPIHGRLADMYEEVERPDDAQAEREQAEAAKTRVHEIWRDRFPKSGG